MGLQCVSSLLLTVSKIWVVFFTQWHDVYYRLKGERSLVAVLSEEIFTEADVRLSTDLITRLTVRDTLNYSTLQQKHHLHFNAQSQLGLPGVRFLTGQSGFLAIGPVKNMMLNRTISCPVFSWPWTLNSEGNSLSVSHDIDIILIME